MKPLDFAPAPAWPCYCGHLEHDHIMDRYTGTRICVAPLCPCGQYTLYDPLPPWLTPDEEDDE